MVHLNQLTPNDPKALFIVPMSSLAVATSCGAATAVKVLPVPLPIEFEDAELGVRSSITMRKQLE